MKKLLAVIAILGTVSSFAATDAQVVGVVFGDQKFVSIVGESRIVDIKIKEVSAKKYTVVVNPNAPMADGCSYSAAVTETLERYPVGPATSGIRTVLKVSNAKANCPRQGGF